ncbi:MAG TPA: hypothetical protein VFC84_13605 [Desulfosporosinus sp.]|nr:hypothetical protein [Desulfosporosinus sp.]
MSHVFNQNGYDAELVLENGALFLSPEDRRSIEDILSKVDIGFGCIELRNGPKASLFHGIAVFINENLTSLFVGRLLMPGAYDAIKFAFKKIVDGIKNGSARIVSANKISMPECILKFVTKKGHLEVPIPNNLTDEQFEKYMDLLKVAIQTLNEDIINQGHLIAEFEMKSEKVIIKTVLEYGRGQWEKQQTEKK